MIININAWLDNIIKKLEEKFDKRLIFIGLQGSYNRGEETPDSDIDLVVILDKLEFNDLKTFRSIVNNMPFKEKACGFISGKKELENWSKLDLFQFYYDTKPLRGNLQNIILPPTKNDIKQSIKSSCENIYHLSAHSFLHSNTCVQDLQNLYKMTFFILQAKYFMETDKYIATKKELLGLLNVKDKEILNICINKDKLSSCDFNHLENYYTQLLVWSSGLICG